MRSNIIFVYTLFIAIMVISVTGCYYDKAELLYNGSQTVNCSTISAKFSPDVKTIIQNKCAITGCHNSASGEGSTILETFTQISGKAARIYQRCVVEKTMPSNGPLLPAEIAVLKCWIDSGAPNN
ncbi:MAG: hypothetical protein ABI760_16295 [Ferruginibacter sp.]